MLRLASPLLVALGVVLLAFTVRLSGTPTLPETPLNYAAIELPDHLQGVREQQADNTPAGNAITDAGATLGRVLFYDTRLSLTETTSCASCHRAEAGFSDPDPLSTGHDGGLTPRHSMGLAFSRYYRGGRFFWDERALSLEQQVLMPIQDAVEMGMSLPALRARLEATDFYGPLFQDAFGTPEVSDERISRALAQFVRSIVSPTTRYDVARAQNPGGGPLPGLTPLENQGRQIFGQAQCAQCHQGELFVGEEVHNNGLDANTDADPGAGQGRFKTGSLRNVALTAPYMHDGRFETLAEVIGFYSTQIQPHPNLDPRLRQPNGQPRRFNFSELERTALIAFLNTLTDETLATDERWSDPFAGSTAGEAEDAFAVGLGLVGANPFRGGTSLSVRLRSAGAARLEAFDLAGRRVAVLHDGALPAGEHVVRWDASDLPAGLYVVRLVANGSARTLSLTAVR